MTRCGNCSGVLSIALLSGLVLLVCTLGGYADDGLMSQVPTAPAVQEIPAEPENGVEYLTQENANILWTCIAAFLVFFMQAGFALVEAGFTRAKNAVNIIMKNMLDFSLGSIIFLLVGFGIMFGTSAGGFFGTDGFGLYGYMVAEDGSLNYWTFTFWIFQVVFAATRLNDRFRSDGGAH